MKRLPRVWHAFHDLLMLTWRLWGYECCNDCSPVALLLPLICLEHLIVWCIHLLTAEMQVGQKLTT